MTSSGTSTKALILGTAGIALLAGWVFILWHHHFHVTASAVMLMTGWAAVLAAVYFLWRTADNQDLDDREDWWKPVGRFEELTRQKKSLLKAIKDTENDRDTGKLSERDAQDIIGRYRREAIAVIKQIDLLETGAGDLRDRIEREVRARLEVDRAKPKKGKEAKRESA
jgi:hypothetical protein